jgi:hypothetical protein
MSVVTVEVVREYFEMQGYLVSQPRKYLVPARTKRAEEEADLVICRPALAGNAMPESFVWETDDLKGISRAVIGIRGWHRHRFYPSTFERTPEILRFVEPDSVKYAAKHLGSSDIAKILCIPMLPASGELKNRTIRILRQKGIDGVISFRTMLAELISGVDKKKNYDKSDLLQIIRLLKNYELLKGGQLELFGRKK